MWPVLQIRTSLILLLLFQELFTHTSNVSALVCEIGTNRVNGKPSWRWKSYSDPCKCTQLNLHVNGMEGHPKVRGVVIYDDIKTIRAFLREDCNDSEGTSTLYPASPNGFTSSRRTGSTHGPTSRVTSETDARSSKKGSMTSTVKVTTDSYGSTALQACLDYLGMRDNTIPDQNIKASSQIDAYPATHARLDGSRFWAAINTNVDPWIQADIGYQTLVSGVVTQGDGGVGYDDYVTTLKVSTFITSTKDTEVFVRDVEGNIKVFDANTDVSSKVHSIFPNPVYARIVRITCLTRNAAGNSWDIRFELLGCQRD